MLFKRYFSSFSMISLKQHLEYYLILFKIQFPFNIINEDKTLHFRIDDGEGILEDDALFRDDVSLVTPGSDSNPQFQMRLRSIQEENICILTSNIYIHVGRPVIR